jgi:hypothetical protein
MRRASSFVVLVLVGWCPIGHSDIGNPPTNLAAWTIPGELATLPSPFWKVEIVFDASEDTVHRFDIAVTGRAIKVDEALIDDLDNPELVEIAYSDPAQTLSGQVEYFELLILTGDPYPVRFMPCDQLKEQALQRDIAVIRVSRNLGLSRRTVSFRELDECETE